MKYRQSNFSKKMLLCLVFVFLGLMSASVTHAENYQFVTKWGSAGSGDGQFNCIVNIAEDSSGHVYAADIWNNRIQEFDSNGNFITKWDCYTPHGIAFDSADNFYVTDEYYHSTVNKYDNTGTLIKSWGSFGSGNGQFDHPGGVAVDSNGFVYVNDWYNNRIEKFDSNGNFKCQIGSYGSGDGQIYGPYDVAVDSNGFVYVADNGNSRIDKFDSNGNFITKWGSFGSGDGQINTSCGITVDSNGYVYVADTGNHRIQVFDSNGNFITKWGSFGSGDGQFKDPRKVVIDPSGKVYVADSGNENIQVFTKVDNIPAPTINSITIPLAPVLVGTTITASASVDYQGSFDSSWTAICDWGDGSTSQSPVSSNIQTSHPYNSPGVYTVTLTLNDNGVAVVQKEVKYVVVYDPNGGFVTGGGWINSPAGAYAADTSLTGKANFGFNSKYQKGANVPTGNTEFNFKVANLNFHSDNYDWLVVAGAKAQYQGTGTINGQGQYRFKLTAIDGQVNGGGGTDKFRIRIWNDGSGIVYDNNKGADDSADPTTIIQGGSITIQE